MNILVYVYNSFDDPLFKGNLLMYIIRSKKDGHPQVYHIITYEQKEYWMSPERVQELKRQLQALDIYWHPLKWHSSPLIKLYDLISGAALVGWLRLTKSAKWMITLGSVSGSFGFLISRLFGMRQYAYQFEPHSEFLLDMKLIKKSSLSFIIFNKIEKLTIKNVEIISTGTDAMLSRLRSENSKGNLFKIPSAIDEQIFFYSKTQREKIRKNLGIEDKHVFIYVGKIGGLYFSEELFVLFKLIKENFSNAYFLILTPQPKELFSEGFKKHLIEESAFFVSCVDHSEIPGYLSSSDIGVVAIPPLPSQKFRSPIKVGEYLLCGLPYITCHGVSEDDLVVEKYETGIVLKDFNQSQISEGIVKIKEVLETDKETMVTRCQNAGRDYRGFSKYYPEYERIIKMMNE